MDKCPHNSGVECAQAEPQRCARCGWSPDGARRRGAPLGGEVEPSSVPLKRKSINGRPVVKVSEDGRVLGRYPTLRQAAAEHNMTATVIKNHTQGRIKNPYKCTGGFTFRYADRQVAT